MGFGFNLFFIFILVPLTGILLIAWLLSRKLFIGKILGFIWLGIFGLVLLSGIIQWLTSKTELDKDDYYGEYVINRDYFKGKQTDWQYNHFRFEITDKDSILFYVTENEKILETYRGTIRTTDPRNYRSARLIIKMDKPTYHILTSNPTTYRSAWDFYLVFKSPKFNNVFFKKGKWKPIE
ncbi:hypothetical protein [Mesonia aestuariivivens]|uniref:Uncharacterized protein n=1 Tax=Mesonia aestuariivivens TaxID=2796128 RepID=A0ABS6W1W1_9FLAO|nr:hypothetical protein [Mesonia aestuariivivens]MBW2961848.1 hypothetical protein [Mesonia aestuariivivens]